MDYKYLLSLNSYKSLCFVRTNSMPAMDNIKSHNGTQSSGLNSSAFLENGSNTMELLFSDLSSELESNKFDPQSWCEATLKKVSATGNSKLISHIKLTVDKNGNTITSESINQKTEGKPEFDFSGMSSIPAEKGLFKAQKTFYINGLPDWKWTSARPVSENDTPAIKLFYQEVINTFSHKDLDKIWQMSKPAWEEWAMADNSNPRVFFDSMRFEDKIDSNKFTVRTIPEWKKFKLVSYKNGRLFRLEAGAHGRSPILFDNKKTGKTATYSPYLSIINGKVVIAR
ncbi:hypothetical protein PSI15_05655 [Xenorhabdus sp. PR6a]|uniref:hypothetical protein n=1 Tax=Xenorhabdus sp. PR6a TaxID=3025877 RepID=UPI002359E2B9|nr:hypothetical protein [Xenorhabdus sp. PR6a]MDC9581063.1 hypothetical protein [Xenorhabdus sp. PR6a]